MAKKEAPHKQAKLPRMKKSDPWRYQSSKWRSNYHTGGHCRGHYESIQCDGDCDTCLNESNMNPTAKKENK